MGKRKAVEIYNNLTGTINKMDNRDVIRPENDKMFDHPRAKRSRLVSTRNKIKEKFNLTKKDGITN